MTAALIAPEDLSQYEFHLPCEFPGCDEEAAVMSKGCADPRHSAICPRHYEGVRRHFHDNLKKLCKDCHRPWVHFETHYDIVAI